MNRLNKILGRLPIVIYFGYIFLLFSILCNLSWFLKYNQEIENIDFVLCMTMVIHALFSFRHYVVFAKSSFVTIMALSFYHLIYYNLKMTNLDYYFYYITILTSNFAYIVLREIIKE